MVSSSVYILAETTKIILEQKNVYNYKRNEELRDCCADAGSLATYIVKEFEEKMTDDDVELLRKYGNSLNKRVVIKKIDAYDVCMESLYKITQLSKTTIQYMIDNNKNSKKHGYLIGQLCVISTMAANMIKLTKKNKFDEKILKFCVDASINAAECSIIMAKIFQPKLCSVQNQ